MIEMSCSIRGRLLVLLTSVKSMSVGHQTGLQACLPHPGLDLPLINENVTNCRNSEKMAAYSLYLQILYCNFILKKHLIWLELRNSKDHGLKHIFKIASYN